MGKEDDREEYSFKIVLIEKLNLLCRFSPDEFDTKFKATIGVKFKATIGVKFKAAIGVESQLLVSSFYASVVFRNISLGFPISFNQINGATTPFFTAVFAYSMTLKREAWLTYFTLVPVVIEVAIASLIE